MPPRNRKGRPFTIKAICDAFSMKRDPYYKFQKAVRCQKTNGKEHYRTCPEKQANASKGRHHKTDEVVT